MKKITRIWACADPHDPETIFGACIHNYGIMGILIASLLTLILTVIYLDPILLIGFLPCSILTGVLLGVLAGSIRARSMMRHKK